MKPHIITDWDGVLADVMDLNFQIINELFPGVERDKYLIDHHLGNVYESPVLPFTPESAAQYFALYNERLAVEHIESALAAIAYLGERYTIHVVTSNCEHAIRRVLQEAGVESYFGHMLGQEAHASKVEKFKRLFAEDGFTAAESLYITDTVGDLKEAEKVGLRTIAVGFGYHPKELLLEHNPTAFAESWEEVCECVDEFMAV